MCVSLFLVTMCHLKEHLCGNISRKSLSMVGVSIKSDVGTCICLFIQVVRCMIQHDDRLRPVHALVSKKLLSCFAGWYNNIFTSNNIKSAVDQYGRISEYGDASVV